MKERFTGRYASHVPSLVYLLAELALQVVKQTVMTIVYGVTWVGGRQQIAVSSKFAPSVPLQAGNDVNSTYFI